MKSGKSIMIFCIAIAAIVILFNIDFGNPTKTADDPNDKYFSAWDGSNRQLVEAVKSTMNDPESFNHISTATKNNNDGTITIVMEFTGKNAFGGVVRNKVIGEFEPLTESISDIKKIE